MNSFILSPSIKLQFKVQQPLSLPRANTPEKAPTPIHLRTRFRTFLTRIGPAPRPSMWIGATNSSAISWAVWYRAERNQLNPKYPLRWLLAPMADGPRPAAPCVRMTFECARINTFRQTLGEIVEQADQQTADWTNQRDRLCRNQRRKIVKCAAATTSTGSMRVSQEGPLEKENPTCREARRMKCEKQIQFKRQIISFPPNAVNFPSIDRSANVAWGSCDHKDQKWPFENAIWSLGGG